MKISNTIITLLVILFLALLIGTLLGFRSPKEGITYNKLTVLEDILKNTNPMNIEANMVAIQSMNIEDPDFANIIENESLTNAQKITQLNLMTLLLSNYDLNGKTYSDAWTEDITLKSV
jgi:hypothetical protein